MDDLQLDCSHSSKMLSIVKMKMVKIGCHKKTREGWPSSVVLWTMGTYFKQTLLTSVNFAAHKLSQSINVHIVQRHTFTRHI